LQSGLYLGNLNAKRDWGHARDYVEMQWRMLQQETPEDYVIATGQQITVREFIDAAAAKMGVTLRWEGEGVDEVGIVDSISPTALAGDEMKINEGDTIIRVDPTYYRPAEVETLLGDPTKAHKELGWKPSTTLDEMVEEMISHDLDKARQQALLRASGFTVNTPRES
jgi:GDPmannose 4,6-dehydratase